MKFMVRCGCMDTDEAHDVSKEFSGMLVSLAVENSKSVQRDDPAVVYIRNLLSLIDSGRVLIIDKNRDFSPASGNRLICYEDARYYYVNAGSAYYEVKRYCSAQDISFTLPQNALYKLLAEKGFIETDGVQNTKVVRFSDRLRRMLCIVKEKAREAESMYG